MFRPLKRGGRNTQGHLGAFTDEDVRAGQHQLSNVFSHTAFSRFGKRVVVPNDHRVRRNFGEGLLRVTAHGFVGMAGIDEGELDVVWDLLPSGRLLAIAENLGYLAGQWVR